MSQKTDDLFPEVKDSLSPKMAWLQEHASLITTVMAKDETLMEPWSAWLSPEGHTDPWDYMTKNVEYLEDTGKMVYGKTEEEVLHFLWENNSTPEPFQ